MRYLGGASRQKSGRAGRKVAGGEKLTDKGQKETKHTQEGFQGKGKEEAEAGEPAATVRGTLHTSAYVSIRQAPRMWRRERVLCPGSQHGKEGTAWGGRGRGGGWRRRVKKGRAKCPHNRQRSVCKECGGARIFEHNQDRSLCKQCGGGNICEQNTHTNTHTHTHIPIYISRVLARAC
jgi:hypothetical protein